MDKPHIEVTGFAARFYDALVLIGTAGLYQGVLKKAIAEMEISPEDRILDLGAGTGKNACMMRRRLSRDGNITALEVGSVMQKQFRRKCRKYDNVTLLDRRIENTLPFNGEFNKVLLSFVIHGFEQEMRETILRNAFTALKPGGTLYIFDWNEMELYLQGPLFRFFMWHLECPEARDFITTDFKKVLSRIGFSVMREILFAGGKIRLLSAVRRGTGA
jgi:ubiquinone/menaquinone biosynthesis C-methylase UbiE